MLGVFTLFSVAIRGQVTIGSGLEPVADALLDMKEFVDGTSARGLLLPRMSLPSYTLATPLSRHVEAMLVYNHTNGGETCINNGVRWTSLTVPQGDVNGQFLVLNAELKPVWTVITIPLAMENKYSLIESRSIPINSGIAFSSDNTGWIQLGDFFNITPAHVKNRIVITVQTIALKEYRNNYTSGWISYSGAVFANGLIMDSRIGRLVYESYNNTEVFQVETLHFVLENMPLSEQKIHIAYKRRNSMNSGGQALYIGARGTNNTLNNFVTRSIISYQYYEDRTSPGE